MKHLLLVSLTLLCSCYSGSSKKGQKDKRDSICLQKELYALHKYVDSIIKIDTILQQRFHCRGHRTICVSYGGLEKGLNCLWIKRLNDI